MLEVLEVRAATVAAVHLAFMYGEVQAPFRIAQLPPVRVAQVEQAQRVTRVRQAQVVAVVNAVVVATVVAAVQVQVAVQVDRAAQVSKVQMVLARLLFH